LVLAAAAALAPACLRAASGDLFASINGSGGNGGGFIYQFSSRGTQSIFLSGVSRPRGVAFESAGNLFVANNFCTDTCQGTILKITPDGTQSTFATLSDNLFLEALAFDRSDNLFVMAQDLNSPTNASTIYEFTPNGIQSTFGSIPGQGWGLAFDSAGNLFAADGWFQTIYKFTPDGTPSVFAGPSAFTPDSNPVGLAFDRFGNLFVSTQANVGNDTILEFTPDSVESTYATGVNYPRGLAFDRRNLFVAEIIQTGPGDVLKFNAGGRESVFASGIGPQGNGGPEFLTIR
jgi:hypothetical protein